jgi:hypothetical protein
MYVCMYVCKSLCLELGRRLCCLCMYVCYEETRPPVYVCMYVCMYEKTLIPGSSPLVGMSAVYVYVCVCDPLRVVSALNGHDVINTHVHTQYQLFFYMHMYV